MAAGATYEPIATNSPSGVSTVTFSSLGSYTDIKVIVAGLITASAGSLAFLRFNGDTGFNYSTTQIYGNGTTATSDQQAGNSLIYINTDTSTTIPQMSETDIFSYSGSTKKTVLHKSANDQNGTGLVYRGVHLWNNTAAITSITVACFANFSAGTTISLYGIKAA